MVQPADGLGITVPGACPEDSGRDRRFCPVPHFGASGMSEVHFLCSLLFCPAPKGQQFLSPSWVRKQMCDSPKCQWSPLDGYAVEGTKGVACVRPQSPPRGSVYMRVSHRCWALLYGRLGAGACCVTLQCSMPQSGCASVPWSPTHGTHAS